MIKILLIYFFVSMAIAKGPLRVLKTYKGKKAIVINRGAEEGLIVGRKVCFNLKPSEVRVCGKVILVSQKRNQAALQFNNRDFLKIRGNQFQLDVMGDIKDVRSKFNLDYMAMVSPELRLFHNNSGLEHQRQASRFQPSIALRPMLKINTKKSKHAFFTKLFYRYSNPDTERSHFDVRKAFVKLNFKPITVKFGWDQVFWGALDSNNPVDILNQRDMLENLTGDVKRGQPLVSVSYRRKKMNFTFFVLPYFIPQQFPGNKSQLNQRYPIDENAASYESDKDKRNLDFAFHVRGSYKMVDYGAFAFKGTDRLPYFDTRRLGNNPSSPNLEYIPFYNQTTQLGGYAKATWKSYIFKLEVLQSSDIRASSRLIAVGVERNIADWLRMKTDLNVIFEIYKDNAELLSKRRYQNDVVLGARWNLADKYSTELSGGFIRDFTYGSIQNYIEYKRSFSNKFALKARYNGFLSVDAQDPLLTDIQDSSFLMTKLEYYF